MFDFNNGNDFFRPIGKKKTVRLMIALTVLAWATQTLFTQWAHGQEVPEAQKRTEFTDGFGAERFMPTTPGSMIGATIELRAEATVVGTEIKLKQVCRWSDHDAAALAPLAEFTIGRVATGSPFRALTLAELKSMLRDAGINIAAINFAGAASCTINRGDTKVDGQNALAQWIDAKQGKTESLNNPVKIGPKLGEEKAKPQAAEEPQLASEKPAGPASSALVVEQKSFRTLRDALQSDLVERLGIPLVSLNISFKGSDERVLALSEPGFQFEIEPIRVRNLGEVAWTVKIRVPRAPGSNEGAADTQKVTVTANARMWQQQVITARPLTHKQVIREEDVADRRALVDRLPDDTLIGRSQAVGQMAGRDLKPGTVLTAKLVDPVQLVRAGQFVTININNGSVAVKTVARAMENGSYGQQIRVKNEATNDVFTVTLTGPQTASMTAGVITANANDPTKAPTVATIGQ